MYHDDPNPRKRLYVILTVVVVFLLAGGLSARPAYRWFKQWRALQMVEASAQALRNRDLKTATEKAESAVRLWPGDVRVLRQEAIVLALQSPAAALPVWIQTWSLSHNPADLREVIETALYLGNNPIAIEQFAILQKIEPENPATWLIEGKIRLTQNQFPEAYAALKKAMEAGNAPPVAHMLYAKAAVLTNDPLLAREGLEHLHALTARTDQLGLEAMRLLGTYPALSAMDAAALAPQLQNHPLATRNDKLLALHLSSLLPGTNEDSLIKAARDLFPPNDPDAMGVVCHWLMSQRKYAAVLQIIDSQTALTRKDLFLLRCDAMAALGQWEAIEKALSSTTPRPPLPEAERLLYEARALMELGQTTRAQIAWQRIVNAVDNEPAKLRDVGLYAVKLGLDDYVRLAFQPLLDNREQRRIAYEQLAQLEHRSRNTAALYKLLLDMAKVYPDDLSVRSDVLYVGFLLGQTGPAQIEAARKLVADSKAPFLAYRVTLALGLLTAGQSAEALKVFDGVADSTWPSGKSNWDAVYIGVLRANGQRDKANRLEQSLKLDTLLPEEKKLPLLPLPPGVVQ